MNQPSSIPIILITSNQGRHHMAADYLKRNFNLLGVVSESRRVLKSGDTPEEDKVIKDYDRECAEKEQEYFGYATQFPLPEEKILRIDYGTCGDPKILEWIQKLNPRYVVLFSASVVKGAILSVYKGKIINLHLGLTPYYRGWANAFWPLVNSEPECLGATIHLVTEKLDSGDVLGQSRPENVNKDDGPRDISNKNVISGFELLIRCIRGYDEGVIVPQTQRFDAGKFYKQKDYNGAAILKLKENFINGMLKNYLENKTRRDKL
ncbi:MAG: formyltransferase family protein, partial [Patescibacteria group bacterium]